MTLHKRYELRCDFPGCSATHSGGWWLAGRSLHASAETRASARRQRWTRKRGADGAYKDLCGSHRGARM
jgi:hypothetical protein